MNRTDILINQIAQGKIEFIVGCQTILDDQNLDFQMIYTQLRNYIFNSIPDKTEYNSETYQNATNTIPLRPTFTPVIILKSFSAKIAFDKLENFQEMNIKKQ